MHLPISNFIVTSVLIHKSCITYENKLFIHLWRTKQRQIFKKFFKNLQLQFVLCRVQLLHQNLEWGKFYPKKVIQKVEVKLSTEISHVNFFIQKFYPKLTWLIRRYFINKKQLPRQVQITLLNLRYFIHENY